MSGYQEKLLTDRQTDRQTDKQTDRQTHTQTDRQTQPSELRLAFGNADHIANQLML